MFKISGDNEEKGEEFMLPYDFPGLGLSYSVFHIISFFSIAQLYIFVSVCSPQDACHVEYKECMKKGNLTVVAQRKEKTVITPSGHILRIFY